jgi:hypothetical protein
MTVSERNILQRFYTEAATVWHAARYFCNPISG